MERPVSGRRPLLASFPPLAFLVALALGQLVHRRWPASLPGGVARPLGVLLLAAGGALDAWAIMTHRRAGTSPIPSAPTVALVADGPYRYSRNPIYLAHALLAIGAGLVATRSAWALPAGMAALRATDRWVVPHEERELTEAFGDEYAHYQQRVRRWL
ncbi:MAG: isoprenylcysteine carboxylmethyltransferase family protein [Dehalococcoidia bacterium]|nr:isoprenylcysteine carboxylmethyltransferase family protein [Dehalococcoidia bacterium]